MPDYIWEQNYTAALEFYQKNEHLDIPRDFVASNGVKVGVWIENLRKLRSSRLPQFNLDEKQISALDDIGMIWDSKFERQWKKGYEEAKKYYGTYGNLDVSATNKTDAGYKLGDWILNQREAFNSIKPERKELLDAIGMIWKKPDPWEVRFSLAEQYYRENGHLKVPLSYKSEGIWLNQWLNEQKHIFRGKRKGKCLLPE